MIQDTSEYRRSVLWLLEDLKRGHQDINGRLDRLNGKVAIHERYANFVKGAAWAVMAIAGVAGFLLGHGLK